MVILPEPKEDSGYSLEKVLNNRESIREFKDEALSLEQVSHLLWAAGKSPSAGAVYPMVIYLVVGKVDNLDAWVYRYNSPKHSLEKILEGDKRKELCKACLNQKFVLKSPLSIVITAIYEKIRAVYGERGIRYAIMEAGHISQNIYLQAESLGLGTVAVGAFHDDYVREVIDILPREHPLYVMPVGNKR